MNQYISNSLEQKKYMLKYLGINSIDRLFDDIPKSLRLNGNLNIPVGISELETNIKMRSLANKNINTKQKSSFLGAGVYEHYIPAHIPYLRGRSEFCTSYTPYQAEISQGTLRGIFEFQSMICNLTKMHTTNASMYDVHTAVAEACYLAIRAQRGDTILVSNGVHPESKMVIDTYMRAQKINVKYIPLLDGETNYDELSNMINKDTIGVVLQTPNFFGVVENYSGLSDICKANKALMIISADPISLAKYKTPGEYGADIAIGECQVLGNDINFGGPHAGYFAVNKKLMRKIPGRVVGKTIDADGKVAYVLTLQAREQHIRRDKATSNICSNQALCALTATMYMATMGRVGLKEVANQCIDKSYYLYNKLISTGHFKPVYNKPFFREFALKCNININTLNKKLKNRGYIGGFDLSRFYDMPNTVLICVTEKHLKSEIDGFVNACREVLGEL